MIGMVSAVRAALHMSIQAENVAISVGLGGCHEGTAGVCAGASWCAGGASGCTCMGSWTCPWGLPGMLHWQAVRAE